MHIRSFHIDGFGIFSDAGVEQLPQGLCIFLGNNEAGKSTCLDFFRAMLTGYPDPRSKEARERSYAPLRGGQAGGFLELDLPEQGAGQSSERGLVRLTRRPGNGGGQVSLTDSQGQPLDLSLLDRMLSGVTREVYRNVFGFSLTELQSFESLNSEGVRHALYGASFGMGLRSPGQVLKALEDRMESLFKSNGSKPPLNAALRQWEDLRQAVQAAEAECARFDALTLEKNSLESALHALRQHKADLGLERRDAERKLGVWKQWDEWRNAENRLARLELVSPTFPQDGPARLERTSQTRIEAARQTQLHQERCQRTSEELSRIEVDEGILATGERLQTLAERKTSFRQAQSALPSNVAAQQRARADLKRLLTDLGPDWTCDRIRQTNRSLFARGELERQATEMQAAEQAHVAATAALEKANRMVENAEHSLVLAQNTLDHLPRPVAALDDAAREQLRRTLTQIEDARQRLPEKKQSLHAARHTLTRTLAPLHLRNVSAGNLTLARERLDHLADMQEKALDLATEVQNTLRQAQDAAQNAAQLHETEENAKARVDRLRAQQRGLQSPSRSALDVRAAAVRSLRHLHNTLSVELDRQTEVTARIKSAVAPAPLKSIPLMGIGIVLMLCGGAGLLAQLQWGMNEISFSQQLIIPLTQWSAYLVVLTGVGFLAGGVPRSGPETQRHAMEMQQLEERANASRLRITELEAQIQEQCVLAEVLNADPVTLDATELLLEREREQCVTDERLNMEMANLEGELASVRERARQAHGKSLQAENVVQQARRRWHEFLLACHVESIPAPEAASAFFARVEAARVALAAVSGLEEEMIGLEEQLDKQWRQVAAIPPVADILFPPVSLDIPTADAASESLSMGVPQPAEQGDAEEKASEATQEAALPQLQQVLDAAHRVLESCREADAAEEERVKAAAALHNAEINMERASTAQGEAVDALHRTEDARGESREAWGSSLEALGLGLELLPGMVREALDCMERCLAAEAEVARLEDEQQRNELECRALTEPLAAILEELGRPLPAAGNARTLFEQDWTAALDKLLADMRTAEENTRQRRRLSEQLDAQREALREAQAALADATAAEEELLRLAGAETAEEFLRLAHVRDQREELSQRKADLEDALRLAAHDEALETFLASFADMDEKERELHIAELDAQLQALDTEEQEKANSLATLTAQLRTLTTADKLGDLRQQEAELAESMQSMAWQWSRHALARSLLLQAKQRFERERQPQVIRTASDIFSVITEGRWRGLTASLEDSSLNVLPPHGEPMSPEMLSRGTQEQMYLAMRLAYIRNHAAHAAALPVIMDDVLVNFDPARARRTAEALLALSQGEKPHQVLFFTCHPHIAAMLQDMDPTGRRFLVENGSIRAA